MRTDNSTFTANYLEGRRHTVSSNFKFPTSAIFKVAINGRNVPQTCSIDCAIQVEAPNCTSSTCTAGLNQLIDVPDCVRSSHVPPASVNCRSVGSHRSTFSGVGSVDRRLQPSHLQGNLIRLVILELSSPIMRL